MSQNPNDCWYYNFAAIALLGLDVKKSSKARGKLDTKLWKVRAQNFWCRSNQGLDSDRWNQSRTLTQKIEWGLNFFLHQKPFRRRQARWCWPACIPFRPFALERVRSRASAAWTTGWCPSEPPAAAAASRGSRDPGPEIRPEAGETSGRKKLLGSWNEANDKNFGLVSCCFFTNQT